MFHPVNDVIHTVQEFFIQTFCSRTQKAKQLSKENTIDSAVEAIENTPVKSSEGRKFTLCAIFAGGIAALIGMLSYFTFGHSKNPQAPKNEQPADVKEEQKEPAKDELQTEVKEEQKEPEVIEPAKDESAPIEPVVVQQKPQQSILPQHTAKPAPHILMEKPSVSKLRDTLQFNPQMLSRDACAKHIHDKKVEEARLAEEAKQVEEKARMVSEENPAPNESGFVVIEKPNESGFVVIEKSKAPETSILADLPKTGKLKSYAKERPIRTGRRLPTRQRQQKDAQPVQSEIQN